METRVPKPLLLFAILIVFWIGVQTSLAAEGKKSEKAPEAAPAEEAVDLDSIKQQYWTKGKSTQVGVVQNRKFTKANKIQIGLTGGVTNGDPFLSLVSTGGYIGYHLNEFFYVGLLGWKTFAASSSALKQFEQFSGATANTNLPYAYYGLESTVSFLYGKLSLLGASIIYYDMHVGLNVGRQVTESGTYWSPGTVLGQRYFFTDWLSLRLDYRMQWYRETILEKQVPTKRGQPIGQRNVFNHSVFVGVDFLFGSKKED